MLNNIGISHISHMEIEIFIPYYIILKITDYFKDYR